MKWDRVLWGVKFRSSLKDDRPMLLGALWHEGANKTPYPGEPGRLLLFRSRFSAREWCRNQMKGYQRRSDCYAQWRFIPVLVRETVRELQRRNQKGKG